MANCNDLFGTFYSEINLNEDQRKELTTSRNAVREKIKKHFKEVLDVTQPKFYGQGSYMMRTQINPLPDKEYDIDDGLYLQHLGEDESKWPIPSTVHQWVVKAVDGHTSTPPVDKNTCVRIIYAKQYHIDIPIYAPIGDDFKLAHKANGWSDADPRQVTDWFNAQISEKGDQLRRVVQYLKAWKDYNNGATKLPSGLILTVLAANHFSADDQDDVAIVNTSKNIYDALGDEFSVKKPAKPYEDLLYGWSDTRKNNFLSKLKILYQRGQSANDAEKKSVASDKWISLFGDRFPKYDEPEEAKSVQSAMKTASPAVISTKSERSASNV